MRITVKSVQTYNHTHTHTKPIWILLKQETVSGSGICWAISKSALSFLQAGCPSCRPINSVKALKGYMQPVLINKLVTIFAHRGNWLEMHQRILQNETTLAAREHHISRTTRQCCKFITNLPYTSCWLQLLRTTGNQTNTNTFFV